MKKALVLALCLIMSLGILAGCGNDSGTASAVDGTTLNYAMTSDIDNFDPFTSQTMQFMNTINFNCYECLMHLNADMEYELDLATSYDQPDDTTYVFHLREGVSFHNGEPFTAEDVVYTIKTIQDPDAGAWRASQYENVKDVVANDDYTVTITLNNPQPAFLDNIAYTAIVSKSTTPESLKSNPIGTGAFKFVSWTPNDNITLTKNSDYWDADKVNFDNLVIRIIPDQNVAIQNMKAGSIQVVEMLTTENAKAVKETDGLKLFESKYANKVYEWEIGRHNNPALADPTVIEAMFLALDKNTIVDSVFNGMVSKAESPFPSSAKFYTSADPCEYDLAKAADLLATTEFKDGFDFDVLVSASTGEEYETLVIWQDALKQLNINMNIKVVDSSIWLEEYLGRTYDMICNSYSMVGTDPATYCNVLLGALSDYQTADLGELNELISKAATTSDEAERTAMYQQIQDLLVEYRPVTSYVESPSITGATESVQGIVINGMGHCFLKGASIVG